MVCAVPAHAVRKIAMGAHGVGALMVFAGGFGESGDDGMALETDLTEWVERVGFRLLGPNSGGIILPFPRSGRLVPHLSRSECG